MGERDAYRSWKKRLHSADTCAAAEGAIFFTTCGFRKTIRTPTLGAAPRQRDCQPWRQLTPAVAPALAARSVAAGDSSDSPIVAIAVIVAIVADSRDYQSDSRDSRRR